VTDGEKEGDDCDEVICVGWGEPGGEWTQWGWRNEEGSWISRKLLELETSNLVCSFVSGMPIAGAQIPGNYPESGRGLGHVTPTIFGSTVRYPSDSLASCFSRRYLVNPEMRFFSTGWPIK